MKKIIFSTKWLVTYSIILAILICFDIAGITMIVRAINESNTTLLSVGILSLVCMLLATGIILFYLNQRACLIWVEDGCLKRKGLLCGFKAIIKPEEVCGVGITHDNKEIYVIFHSDRNNRHGATIIKFKNNDANMEILKSFCKIEDDVIAAHKYCENNKESLKGDSVCGCFYCLKIFSPTEITEWILDTKGTALCPYCSIDSVIGESSGYPITEEFLKKMKKHWF